jgi:hypothetical protein
MKEGRFSLTLRAPSAKDSSKERCRSPESDGGGVELTKCHPKRVWCGQLLLVGNGTRLRNRPRRWAIGTGVIRCAVGHGSPQACRDRVQAAVRPSLRAQKRTENSPEAAHLRSCNARPVRRRSARTWRNTRPCRLAGPGSCKALLRASGVAFCRSSSIRSSCRHSSGGNFPGCFHAHGNSVSAQR